MSVTIKDVARKAKVDPSTVSRAINNNGRVSEATRRKVLEAARKLGYHPNIMARGLVLKKTKTIGFVVHKFQASSLAQGSFYHKVLEGVEEEIKKHRYHLIFSVIDSEPKDKSISADIIRKDRIDGLLLVGCSIKKEIILGLKEKGIPLVLVDNHLDREKISSVVTDNVNGAYEAVSHLINLGHKKIGFITETLDDLSFSERLEGYKLALKQHDLDYNEKLVQEGGRRIGGGYIAMKKLLDSSLPPLAVFTANDYIATETMRIIRERGLKIPQDVAIVGFDDQELSAHIHPSLTTVRVSKKQMGQIAGWMLMEIINDKNAPAVKNLMSTELIVRESCGAKFK